LDDPQLIKSYLVGAITLLIVFLITYFATCFILSGKNSEDQYLGDE